MADTYFFAGEGLFLRLAFYTEKTVRVTYSAHKNPRLTEVTEFAAEPYTSGISESTERGDCYRVTTGEMDIFIDKKSLSIRYERKSGAVASRERGYGFEKHDVFRTVDGRIETTETVDGERSRIVGGEREFVREAYSASLDMSISDNERLFGLGSHEEGYESLEGHFLPLYQENMRVAVPIIVSSLGYAYLFNCASFMTFDATDKQTGKMNFDTVDAIDHFFILGGGFDDVCHELRLVTGSTPMLPMWACGYIQSKERYKSGDELVKVAAEYRRRGVPLDAVVQDWMYWRDGMWGDKHFDPERYPEPDKTTEALHTMGVRMMISVWPNMLGGSTDRREFEESGLMLSDGSVYNAFSQEGRALYAKQAFEGLFDHGVDGWWCDSTEPYDAVWHGKERPPLSERMELSVSEFKKYIDPELINAFSLAHSKGIYEAQRLRSQKRVINLTRSGFPGQHRYGTIVWSGDVSASWETLGRQVRIMQNYISCGEAYWSSDVGGFFVSRGNEWFRRGEYQDGCHDPAFRELYTRWMQFSVFTPFMRSHGTDTPREIWRFGEPGEEYYDAIEAAIRLRYRLIPYFYSVNAAVTFRGEMPIRPLALEFPNDAAAGDCTDEYMYGHELLVCPVTQPICECITRRVYFPALSSGGWFDLYSGRLYEGGTMEEIVCEIGSIPVFVRSGSIIPMFGDVNSTDELLKSTEPYNVIVFGGANGSFSLYEDAGDGYEYESGEYSMTIIKYDDKSGSISEKSDGDTRFRRRLVYTKVQR